MTVTARTLIAALLAAGLAVPAAAREVTAEDRAEVARLLAQYEEAARQGDVAGLIELIPPAILETIARANDLSVEALRETMTATMSGALGGASIESFETDLDAAAEGETQAGRPYLAIPTSHVTRVGERRVAAGSTTLAFEDGGRWFVTRVDVPSQAEILREAFPDFDGVEIPRASAEADR